MGARYEDLYHEAKAWNWFCKLLKEKIVKTKYMQYLVVLSTLALLFPLGALARDNAHSVQIYDVVQIAGTQLKPGNYRVEWQGTGPGVEGTFHQTRKNFIPGEATLETDET